MASALRTLSDRLQASSLVSRLAVGSFWSMLAAVISRLANLACGVFVARALGKVGFGQFGILQSTVMTFASVAVLGLGVTATRYIAELRDTDTKRAGRLLALSDAVSLTGGLIFLLLVYVMAPAIAKRTMMHPGLAGPLRICSLLLFLNTCIIVQDATLSGFEAFRSIAIRNLVSSALTIPSVVVGLRLYGLNGALYGLIVGCAINITLNIHAISIECRRYGISLDFRGISQELPVLWRFSLPSIASGLMVTPVIWMGNAFLVRQAHGYAEMGVYSSAMQVRSFIIYLPSIIATVLLPTLANCKHNRDEYTRLFRLSLTANVIMTLVISGGVVCLAPQILSVYGASFRTNVIPLVVLSLSSVFYVVSGLYGQLFTTSDEMYWIVALNCIWGVIFLACAHVLCRTHGAAGLAGAFAIAQICHASLFVAMAKRLNLLGRQFAKQDSYEAVESSV